MSFEKEKKKHCRAFTFHGWISPQKHTAHVKMVSKIRTKCEKSSGNVKNKGENERGAVKTQQK